MACITFGKHEWREYRLYRHMCSETLCVVIGLLGVVMEELQPHILVRPDGMIIRVGCWNIRTKELGKELTILETNQVVLS